MSEPRLSKAGAWGIISLLFCSALINYLDRATMSVALPMLAVTFHLGPVQKGMLLWSLFGSYALMQVPVGWLVHRLDLKWFYAGMYRLDEFSSVDQCYC